MLKAFQTLNIPQGLFKIFDYCANMFSCITFLCFTELTVRIINTKVFYVQENKTFSHNRGPEQTLALHLILSGPDVIDVENV